MLLRLSADGKTLEIKGFIGGPETGTYPQTVDKDADPGYWSISSIYHRTP